ncbi:hypothetical protein NUW54_g5669 [Trametes sanguinea]|uniref:Uncharacterized protein n=1 Tax=Trametes sanguinea TaxID=158606 RepID=A0ACC1PW06_9APHY|nr:hypothetical protein NUW54_g5669 [Trametes sanguinea]
MTTPGVHTGHTNPGHRGTSFAAVISPSRLLDALLISDRRRLLARESSADPLQGYLNNLNITNPSYVTHLASPGSSAASPTAGSLWRHVRDIFDSGIEVAEDKAAQILHILTGGAEGAKEGAKEGARAGNEEYKAQKVEL